MTFEPQYLAFYTLPGPGGEIEQQIMEQEIRDRMPGPQYARYAQKYPDNIRDLRGTFVALVFGYMDSRCLLIGE